MVDYRRPLTPVSEVEKTDLIMDRLKRIAKKGFSPSSLSLFLKDPLDFYHQRVLGIRENQTLEVTINNMDKGNLVHEVLETLYLPYQNKILKPSDFDEMRYKFPHLMEENTNQSTMEIIKEQGETTLFLKFSKSLFDFLAIEEASINQGNEIKILDLEKSFEHSINIPELDFPIKLIGIVDRMDQFNGTLRIIDYKTGLIQPKQLRLKDWKHLREDSRFSLFIPDPYLFLCSCRYNFTLQKSYAGIISFRNLPEYFMPFETKNRHSYAFSNDNLKNFEKVLFELIGEIFNSRIPFKASI